MTRKLFGIFTTVVASLLVVGVAWANTGRGSGEDETSVPSSTVVTAEGSSSTDGTGVSTPISSSTSVTSVGSTSTSIDDSSTTSVTTPGSSSTSTTIDDDDDDDDDEDDDRVDAATGGVFLVPGVGTVEIQIENGQLVLGGVVASGWSIEIEDQEPDKIKIEFRRGEAEAEFEAEIHHGGLSIKIEND